MIKIGTVELKNPLILAPMAGVTDLAFREICREQGAALTVTEMVSAKALCYGDKKTPALLKLGHGEHPAAVQIFGSEPDFMARGAAIALEMSGADIIDINMGCPVGKVAGNGEGSGLMKTPEIAEAIIRAVRAAVPVPVTVKFRKGWDKGNVNAVEFAQMAEDAGAAAIAVHGRTRAQMYEGKADWDIIRDVKKAVSIPVAANGDVFEPSDASHILRYTGADMVMIGRGSFGNPWLFSRALAELEGGEILPLPPLSARVDTAMRQVELAAQDKGERVACLEARRHFAWYLKGVSHAGYFKRLIVQAETLEELRQIAAGIKRELR
ncbi:MAG: tRNA dihydrouridine synthase DusB [Candidatus Heteroscillospira sp.]|jgi:tRNA-dihydrouridine synthase B